MSMNNESNKAAKIKCKTCGCIIDMSDFKDELAEREFESSGNCQLCQDEIYFI